MLWDDETEERVLRTSCNAITLGVAILTGSTFVLFVMMVLIWKVRG